MLYADTCGDCIISDTLTVHGEEKVNDGPATAECEFLDTDFTSPLQVTPLFRSLAAEIPTPKFSESVRNLCLVNIKLIQCNCFAKALRHQCI